MGAHKVSRQVLVKSPQDGLSGQLNHLRPLRRMVHCLNVEGWVEEPGQAVGALEKSGTVDSLYISHMQGALEAPGENTSHYNISN